MSKKHRIPAPTLRQRADAAYELFREAERVAAEEAARLKAEEKARKTAELAALLRAKLDTHLGVKASPTAETIEIEGIGFQLLHLRDSGPILSAYLRCPTCGGHDESYSLEARSVDESLVKLAQFLEGGQSGLYRMHCCDNGPDPFRDE